MKVVILAGGFGTRLSEYTETIPKPMVSVGGYPIIVHIMHHYARFGYTDFIVALGYKSQYIKDYFKNFSAINSDFSINLSSGQLNLLKPCGLNWNVTLIDTGQSTLTGGRLLRLKEYLTEDTFMLTYGDGVSDVNIQELLSFHRNHSGSATVTAVHPPSRFGELVINDTAVTMFKEKSQLNQGWINGGFFVFDRSFLSLLVDDLTILEREPLESAAASSNLFAFQHTGFWQCMDTKRDRDFLESVFVKDETNLFYT